MAKGKGCGNWVSNNCGNWVSNNNSFMGGWLERNGMFKFYVISKS